MNPLYEGEQLLLLLHLDPKTPSYTSYIFFNSLHCPPLPVHKRPPHNNQPQPLPVYVSTLFVFNSPRAAPSPPVWLLSLLYGTESLHRCHRRRRHYCCCRRGCLNFPTFHSVDLQQLVASHILTLLLHLNILEHIAKCILRGRATDAKTTPYFVQFLIFWVVLPQCLFFELKL